MSFTFSSEQATALINIIDAARAEFGVNPSGENVFTAAYTAVYDAITDDFLIIGQTTGIRASGA